jgi:hypothetical protein
VNNAHITGLRTTPGLPDGLFSNQKYLFGYILKGFEMGSVGMVFGHWGKIYGHLVYFMSNWQLSGNFVYFIFPHFSILCQEKSGNHARPCFAIS